ncbi:MAG: hypothetical protein PF569_02205 [Candidatus Woesearchaeota archaeon]|jgi:hypothetical protein|nr:hypothetical protein [Candidatus Woesearchaeota archaeon]
MGSKISDAINTYFGNYCARKCFRHDEIINDCSKKFDILRDKLSNSNIDRKEFNKMMRNGDIQICKLPYNKRHYVSWKYFEKLSKQDKDYWDLINEENGK